MSSKITLQAWWCGNCKTRNTGRSCTVCTHPRVERHAQVHQSDRAVVYYNPATGEHRTPARADMPMPEIYAQEGFERQEIMSMTAYERQTGIVHEASNYHSGNEEVLTEPAPSAAPPELKRHLIDEMRAAIASGPWTGSITE